MSNFAKEFCENRLHLSKKQAQKGYEKYLTDKFRLLRNRTSNFQFSL